MMLRAVPGLRPMYRAMVPAQWRERINGHWRLKGRPALSAANRERLTAIFNEDLAQLGRWLGIELHCDNFRTQVESQAYAWSSETMRLSA